MPSPPAQIQKLDTDETAPGNLGLGTPASGGRSWPLAQQRRTGQAGSLGSRALIHLLAPKYLWRIIVGNTLGAGRGLQG